jgi:hypothetical protein
MNLIDFKSKKNIVDVRTINLSDKNYQYIIEILNLDPCQKYNFQISVTKLQDNKK